MRVLDVRMLAFAAVAVKSVAYGVVLFGLVV